MKICILTEYLSYVGGGERVYCNWANILAENLKHQVTVLSLEDTDKTYYELSPLVEIKSLKLRKFKYYMYPIRRRIDMILNFYADRKCLNEYFQENRYDCVIGIATNICMLLATVKTNCPKIGTEHTEYYAPIAPLRMIRNKLYTHLDYLTVLTKADVDLYKNFMKNVSVMLNPLSFSASCQSALNNKILISVGSLSPQKNQKRMLEAFFLIHRKHPDWKLIIYGEGILRDALLQYTKKLNLEGFVEFPGTTHDVHNVLSQASIFLLTSKIEGFGLVLIEAMACGLPCVSFQSPGPNSIIEDSYNGYLINQGNTIDFAEKVCLLIENFSMRKSMGENGFNSIQKYSLENAAIAWNYLLTEIVTNENSSNNNPQ